MTTLTIEKLHPDFGARVTGADLAGPLTESLLEEIREAIDLHSFLCFPGQRLDDATQLAFTQALGEPEAEHVTLGREGRVVFFGTIGNLDEAGNKQGNAHPDTKHALGNNMWHSDSSFREVPTYVTITRAEQVPDEGGETAFISGRAAHARLSAADQARIEPLRVVHDYVYSRSKVAQVHPAHAASLPPVEQKLVRRNPRTGARNYFVGSHAKSVVGWGEAESRELLEDLLARATRPEDIYAHRWQAGDLVIWDNRCLLHRGLGYDADKYRRYMRQTRVRGVGSSLVE